MAPIPGTSFSELLTHAVRWLSNLQRAKAMRKQDSISALRKVISASRETSVYIRQLNDEGKREHKTERHLTLLWTELGFALEDLGLHKLAKRCQISGKHWADPEHYSKDFLSKANVSLDKMERTARSLLTELNQH
ncbi:hypothetical protein [Neptuniibacter caesariensis]|nr:hypothetical protein [Neptuniibacter caesariensis]